MPSRMVLASALGSLLILFLLAPLIAVFLTADPGALAQITATDRVLSSEMWGAFRVTLAASILSTALLVVVSTPLAYLLVRSTSPLKRVLEAVIDVPLMLPHAVAGILLLTAYGRGGLLSPLLGRVGLYIEDSFLGVVAVMAFVSAPIMVDTIKVDMAKIGYEVEIVARSLGASRLQTFTRVIIPMSMNGIVSASILSWARAVSEVGALLIVAYYPKTVNVLIIEWFNVYGLRYAASLSLLMVLLSLAAFTALRMVGRK